MKDSTGRCVTRDVVNTVSALTRVIHVTSMETVCLVVKSRMLAHNATNSHVHMIIVYIVD